MAARSIPVLFLAAAIAGCAGGAGPLPERPAPPQTRLVPAPAARVEEAAVAALEEEDAAPDGDRAEGEPLRSAVIQVSLRRLDRRGIDRIRRIADFEPARRLGMRGVSEILIQYAIDVAPLDDDSTRLEIAADLVAIDRSQVIFLGAGAATVVPQRYPLRSRGVLERELMLRIAQRVLLGEEMLYFLGELGKE